jgi:hypothetical protein
MTINIDNTVFAAYKQAAQIIRDRLHEKSRDVPLNELIGLLIDAELSRPQPEDIARRFLLVGEWFGDRYQVYDNEQPQLFPRERECLQKGEDGTNPIAAPKPDPNIGAERLKQ